MTMYNENLPIKYFKNSKNKETISQNGRNVDKYITCK